jgi:hypothetical protein
MLDTEDSKVWGMPTTRSAILREQGCWYQERGDTDAEECNTEGAGMLIPTERGCQYRERRDANTEREGMPIQRERGCQYRERGDANTEREGMPIQREKGCQCWMLPDNNACNSTTINETIWSVWEASAEAVPRWEHSGESK